MSRCSLELLTILAREDVLHWCLTNIFVNSSLAYSQQTRDRHYIYREVFCNLFRRVRWSNYDSRSFRSQSCVAKKLFFRNVCKEKRLRAPRSMIATREGFCLRAQCNHVDERSINENACFRFIHKAFAYGLAQQLIGPT